MILTSIIISTCYFWSHDIIPYSAPLFIASGLFTALTLFDVFEIQNGCDDVFTLNFRISPVFIFIFGLLPDIDPSPNLSEPVNW